MNRHLPDEFCTQRLRLRCPVIADASVIFQSYAQDLEVCRFMVWKPHDLEAVTREFIATCVEAWKIGERLPYVITERGSNVAIGMIDARIQDTAVDIGYVLARAHWGRGFMPEAIQSLTAAILENPQFFRVQATCDTENISSQRALEKSGFNREGRLERHTVRPNISPEPQACFMYSKCR
jgi:ribosomal-protein-alanine N-acetyltransferase